MILPHRSLARHAERQGAAFNDCAAEGSIAPAASNHGRVACAVALEQLIAARFDGQLKLDSEGRK